MKKGDYNQAMIITLSNDKKKEFKKGRKAYVFEDILMGRDKVMERFPESTNIIAIIVKTIDNE